MKFVASQIQTAIGTLLAVADDEKLYALEFSDHNEVANCKTAPILSIEKELDLYFSKKLKQFNTPIALTGTPFQIRVWQELQKIPHGATCSYSELAQACGKPSAYRAAAQANARNKFIIIVPCHRVINANGTLGGYNSGLERKIWLLKHEGSSFVERQ